MPKVTVFNQQGDANGEVSLNNDIFGIEPNENVLFDAIIMQRASQRQGTHAVKNRSAVRGGGRKPWRQKGTDRARHGSNTSPIWRGGGVIFGPTPRSYSYKLPKKVRRLAILSALSQKALDDEIIVIDELNFDQPKTKDFQHMLDHIGVERKALVVLEKENEFAKLSARNIEGVKVVAPDNVSVLDVVAHDDLILTKTALEAVEEALQ
ncbi:50S ribosomal protein L4 [Dolosigranulum pigrum]|uniref:50S ribosomal protein L4 n=1 Tax=Dolosigranulum pigrum TaxID=29394 RepID=UPI0024308911|nr:50S ribosomal protein L4 [Dolosigranulum pigrum]